MLEVEPAVFDCSSAVAITLVEADSTVKTLQSPRCRSFGSAAGVVAIAIEMAGKMATRPDGTNSVPINSELTARTCLFLLPSLTVSLKHHHLASDGSLSEQWPLQLRLLPTLSLLSAFQCVNERVIARSGGWRLSLAVH